MGRTASLLFYMLIMTLLLVMYFYDDKYIRKVKEKNIKVFRVVFFVLFVLVFGFRHCVGTDYGNYQYLILNMIVNFTEPLNILLFGLGYILNDTKVTFVAYAFLTIFIYIAAIERLLKRREERIIALMMYLFIYFPHSLNTMREGLAIVVVMLSYAVLKEDKNIKKAVIIFICAVGIHNSMLFFLPIYIAIIIERFYNLVSFGYIAFIAALTILLKCNLNLPIWGRFQHYFGEEVIEFGVGVLAMNIPLLLSIVIINFIIKGDKCLKETSIISANGVIVRHLAYINEYFYRFSSVFNIFNCIVFAYIPKTIDVLGNKLKRKYPQWKSRIEQVTECRVVLGLIYIFCCLCFIYQFYICNTGEIMQYRIKLF